MVAGSITGSSPGVMSGSVPPNSGCRTVKATFSVPLIRLKVVWRPWSEVLRATVTFRFFLPALPVAGEK